MEKTKTPVLLKVTSILLIIGGVLDIVVGLITALLGAAVMFVGIGIGEAGLAGIGVLLIVLSLIYGVLKLVAGILGVQGKKLNTCLTLIIIILALCLFSLITAAVGGTFTWYSLVSLILPVFYFVGVWMARKQKVEQTGRILK